MADHRFPGVYIEDVAPLGPIAGVETSTAAFVGAAARGRVNAPTRITSWSQFKRKFGEYPPKSGFHLLYAVRGFFENGGAVCYVTRVKTRARSSAKLMDGDGLPQYQAALDALEKVEDVSLVYVDRTDVPCQRAVITHCERLGNRFAILDSPASTPPFGAGSVLAHRAAVQSERGFAALYYPWIRINASGSLVAEDTIEIPPSGHLAGVFARSDVEHGVHKAPANELIRGAIGLERMIEDAEARELNADGVNVLRVFPERTEGPVVAGAHTTAPRDATRWRYVNVRRLLLFIEHSIGQGVRWAVFEPNDAVLWEKLRGTIREFLRRVWQSGALVGRMAQEAFYVRIDEALNSPTEQAFGRVNIEIGVAPERPAEFVVIRIGLRAGGVSEVAEAAPRLCDASRYVCVRA